MSYQEDAKASQKPLEKKAIWQTILQAFKESCQDKAIESEEILTQLKEKWNSLVENYKKSKDNNKATRRERESFKFLEELDSILGCRDKISPRYTCKTDICTDNPDKDSSTGDLTSPSTRGRSSNSDGEDCAEVDNDKATLVKILEALPKKAEKCTADKKNNKKPVQIIKKLEKQKKTGKRESLTALLQGQQQMMTKAEEHDHLAY